MGVVLFKSEYYILKPFISLFYFFMILQQSDLYTTDNYERYFLKWSNKIVADT